MFECSPTPWRLSDERGHGIVDVLDAKGNAVTCGCTTLEQADLIVLAVNSHAALVDSMRFLLSYVGDGSLLMRDEDARFRNGRIDVDTSSSNMEYNEQVRLVIAEARTALAKAGEQCD